FGTKSSYPIRLRTLLVRQRGSDTSQMTNFLARQRIVVATLGVFGRRHASQERQLPYAHQTEALAIVSEKVQRKSARGDSLTPFAGVPTAAETDTDAANIAPGAATRSSATGSSIESNWFRWHDDH